MKIIKTHLLLIATILLLAGCTIFKPKYTGSIDVTGTNWAYVDSDERYQIKFEEGGIVSTTNPADNTYDNDEWTQTGGTVEFYFNNKYSHYTAHFDAPNKLSGIAKNSTSSWKFKMTRIE